MSRLVKDYEERSFVTEQIREARRGCDSAERAAGRFASLYRAQLRSLGAQLFFQQQSMSVRHVGMTAAEDSNEIAQLCFELARMLAEESRYDIGLIDANPESLPLETQLKFAPPATRDSAWPVAPHLWFVPRQNWMFDRGPITVHNTSRLREFAAEFDFSILHCPPVSWLLTNVSRACDGLVLVVSANKTRRLAARQMKDQLEKAEVPVLGTVLQERRLPIPEALYRNL